MSESTLFTRRYCFWIKFESVLAEMVTPVAETAQTCRWVAAEEGGDGSTGTGAGQEPKGQGSV